MTTRNSSIEVPTERIWQGRLHVGDEPGVYGDASYVGLRAQLAFMVLSFGTGTPGQRSIVVEAKGVKTFDPYPGHVVTVYQHVIENGQTWKAVEIGSGRLLRTEEELEVPFTLVSEAPAYLSVSVEIDLTVPPGLYNDFVITKLSLSSNDLYASFGFFHAEKIAAARRAIGRS